jgi:hypothetical protein
MKKQSITLLTLFSLLIFWTCSAPDGQDTNMPHNQIDSFESAIPHGTPLSQTEFSALEKSKLRSARGKEVELISVDSLRYMFDRDSIGLVLYNFLHPGCTSCKETSKMIVELHQNVIGPDKFNIVHLIPKTSDVVIINGMIREWDLVDPVNYIQLDTFPAGFSVIDNNWNGQCPAILLINKEEGLRLFYQKTFNINELEAILLPLTF